MKLYLSVSISRHSLVLVVLFLGKGNKNGDDIWVPEVFRRLEALPPLELQTDGGSVGLAGFGNRDGVVAA